METLEIKDLDKAIDYATAKTKEATNRTQEMRYKSLERAMMIARHTILRAGAIWSLKLENIDLKGRVLKIGKKFQRLVGNQKHLNSLENPLMTPCMNT
jgi:integrase